MLHARCSSKAVPPKTRDIHVTFVIIVAQSLLASSYSCGSALVSSTQPDAPFPSSLCTIQLHVFGSQSRASDVSGLNGFDRHVNLRNMAELNISALQLPRLDQNRREIRLLRVSLSSNSLNAPGGISCYAEVYDLTYPPKYIALSYRWGPATQKHEIHLNGRPFHVRDNLYHFLRRWITKPKYCDKFLWVDQLSNDQSSNGERSHQVGFMDQIYRSAHQTVLWLGADDGLDSCRDLVTFIPQAWLELDGIQSSMDRIEAQILSRHGSSRHAKQFASTVAKSPWWWLWLSGLEYWTRLWVIQEIFLSSDIDVWLGSYSISWTSFCTGVSALEMHSYEFRNSKRCGFLRWLEARRSSRLKWEKGFDICYNEAADDRYAAEMSLPNCLLATSSHLCENPLDTVFALGALVPAGEMVEIDYNMSAEQCFTSVVRRLDSSLGLSPEPSDFFLDVCSLLFIRMGLLNHGHGYTLKIGCPDLFGRERFVAFRSVGALEVGMLGENPAHGRRRVYWRPSSMLHENGTSYEWHIGQVDVNSKAMKLLKTSTIWDVVDKYEDDSGSEKQIASAQDHTSAGV